jgi:hypothetical protein
MRLILTIVGNALALLATAYFVPGIRFTGEHHPAAAGGAHLRPC